VSYLVNKIPSINSELKDDTDAQADLIKKSREISLINETLKMTFTVLAVIGELFHHI